jgi:hypothetical protein
MRKTATFARLAQTEEALPGANSLAEGSQDELVQIAVHQSTCRHFITVRFLLGFLSPKTRFKRLFRIRNGRLFRIAQHWEDICLGYVETR